MSLPLATDQAHIARPQSRPMAILLVDDDPDCRQLTRDAIERSELGPVAPSIYEVSSGEEALAFLHREGLFADAPRPGLIYMDVEMPGMGGHETLRAVRAESKFADIAVVMMTGVTDDEQKRRAMRLGANSYANKPADAMAFIQTVIQATEYWMRVHQHPARPTEEVVCN